MFENIDRRIPNILTALRVVAIPFFIICSLNKLTIYALFIFIFACITDYYDGYIARKYGFVTTFGKIMDPIADKLLVLSALIILNIPPIGYIHWIVTVVIALREILVTVARQYYQARDIIIPAKLFGKIKTVLQMIGIIACLTFYNFLQIIQNFFHNIADTINGVPTARIILGLQIYFWVIVLVTILSGIEIFYKGGDT